MNPVQLVAERGFLIVDQIDKASTMKLILSKQTRRFVMDFVKAYPKWFFFIRWTLAGYLAFYLLKSIVLFITGF